jgi:hypothetical protein
MAGPLWKDTASRVERRRVDQRNRRFLDAPA